MGGPAQRPFSCPLLNLYDGERRGLTTNGRVAVADDANSKGDDEKAAKNKSKAASGVGIAFDLTLGSAFGLLMRNLALGVGIGVAIVVFMPEGVVPGTKRIYLKCRQRFASRA